MNSTYAQKSSTIQKAADTKAASVLDSSAQNESLQRKADMASNAAQRVEAPRPNNTGMPDNLKSGIESLSGFSMDNVRVHYNSSKPATVQALAYTQGTDIHVAPGQEKCLPHEAWHVAQQMAGRVSPTTNINGMPVNDNAALEHEADVMGEKAVTQRMWGANENGVNWNVSENAIQCKFGDHGYIHLDVEKDVVVEPKNPRSGSTDSALSNPDDLLPVIAFEVVVGKGREQELVDLYKNEIRRYKGKAYIYVGVNVFDETSELDDLDKIVAFLEKDLQSHLNYNHHLILVPFIFQRTDPGKEYIFPFMEARRLLMEKAELSDATIFRWVDSDVRDDSSIQAINMNGYAEFDCFHDYSEKSLEDKKQESKKLYDASLPIVYSGFYNWRDDGKLGGDFSGNLQKINRQEANLRYVFWREKGFLIEQARRTGLLTYDETNEGYIPEPIAYMNRLAHQKAMDNLRGQIVFLNGKEPGKRCQQNESRAAFLGAHMVYKPNYSVSKPVKNYFEKVDCGKVDLGCMKSVRQSAFGKWGMQDKGLSRILNADDDSFCKMKEPEKEEKKSEKIPFANVFACGEQSRRFIYDSFVCFCRLIKFSSFKKKEKENIIEWLEKLCSSSDKMINEICQKMNPKMITYAERTILYVFDTAVNICLDAIDYVLKNKKVFKESNDVIDFIRERIFVFFDNFNIGTVFEQMIDLELCVDQAFNSFRMRMKRESETKKDDMSVFLDRVRKIVLAISNPEEMLDYEILCSTFNNVPDSVVRVCVSREFIEFCLGDEPEENVMLVRGAVESIVRLFAKSKSGNPSAVSAVLEVCKKAWIPKQEGALKLKDKGKIPLVLNYTSVKPEYCMLKMALVAIEKLMLSENEVHPELFRDMFLSLKKFLGLANVKTNLKKIMETFFDINELMLNDLIRSIEIGEKIDEMIRLYKFAMDQLECFAGSDDVFLEIINSLFCEMRGVVLNGEERIDYFKFNENWKKIILLLSNQKIDKTIAASVIKDYLVDLLMEKKKIADAEKEISEKMSQKLSKK